MNHIIPPPVHLAPYVRYYWVMDTNTIIEGAHVLQVCADIFPRMVFQHKDGHSAFSAGGESLPTAYLSGIKTRPIILNLTTNAITIVSFYPDALKTLFRVDAHELINGHPDLSNFAPRELAERMMETVDLNAKISMINDFLTVKLQKAVFSTDFLVSNATKWFHQDEKPVRVHSFLKKFHVSEKQLERKFRDHVGITFKNFLRIQRFEKAFALLKSSDYPLAEIAFLSDFFDQPHFSREFKEFTGFTPHTFRHKTIMGDEGNAVLTQ